jgi:hypothetical protein
MAAGYVALQIGDWYIWKWNNEAPVAWHMKYTVHHRCGSEMSNRAGDYYGSLLCNRCQLAPPPGLIAVYELLKWGEDE